MIVGQLGSASTMLMPAWCENSLNHGLTRIFTDIRTTPKSKIGDRVKWNYIPDML